MQSDVSKPPKIFQGLGDPFNFVQKVGKKNVIPQAKNLSHTSIV